MTIKPQRHLAFALTLAAFLLLSLLFLLPAAQSVRADPGTLFASVSGAGTACTQPAPCELQTALGRAVNGDVLYVGAGTYAGSGDAVVTITHNITLYGGWNGVASGVVARDPAVYRSVLDGQGQRRGVYADAGVAFTLDGFTVQNGNANSAPSVCKGGGILALNAWPVITNNVITGNVACTASGEWGYGGGIYLGWTTGSALIEGNQVIRNTAGGPGHGAGGGITLQHADAAQVRGNIVSDNTAAINGHGYGGGVALLNSLGTDISENTVERNRGSAGSGTDGGRGGGVYIERSTSAVLSRNRIRHNVAGVAGFGYGGGVAAYWADELWLLDSILEGNTAAVEPGKGAEGGALMVYSSQNALVGGNRMLGNTANTTSGRGGAVWLRSNTSFLFANNILAKNAAAEAGGGLGMGASETEPVTGTLWHNTFAGNDAVAGFGGAAVWLNSPFINIEMVNNLLFGHSYGIYVPSGSSAVLQGTLFYANSNSDIAGGGTVSNIGSITGEDPLLTDSYHLSAGSPAIDAGVYCPLLGDIDGDGRPLGAGLDIGADEYTEPLHAFVPLVQKAGR
jgi:hypothetical protein